MERLTMAEYIERKPLLERAEYDNNYRLIISAETIKAAPTADVALVVHGQWENGNPICPICGEDKFKDLDADIWCDWKPDYCPNCGAKMDGGVK